MIPEPAAQGPASAATAPAPLAAGAILRRTIGVWRRNLPALTLVSAILHVPVAAFWALPAVGVPLDALDGRFASTLAGVALGSFVETLMGGAFARGVTAELRGGRAGPGVLLADVARRGPALLVLALLRTGAVLGGSALMFLPGILLRLATFVASPVVALERRGPFAAIARSIALTRGSLGAIFVALLVLGIVERFATAGAEALLSPLSEGFPWSAWALSHLAAAFATAPVGVAAAVAYGGLRASKEGGDGAELARVFE